MLNTERTPGQICFLVNNRSGGRQGTKLLNRLDELLEQHCFQGHAFPIQDLSELDINNVFRQHDLIVLAGGDGTIANLLPQLMETGVKTAVIPLGTGNDLARELNILHAVSHKHAGKALEIFASAQSQALTVWEARLGDRDPVLFCNYLSIGFDARVISAFSGMRETFGWIPSLAGKHGNRFLYGLAALGCWNSRIPAGTTVVAKLNDGREEVIDGNVKSLLFSNIAAIMGLGWVSPSSNGFDDTLELNIITSPFDYARMMTPFQLNARTHQVIPFRTIELHGLPGGIPVQSDGEDRGMSVEGTLTLAKRGTVNLCVL